MSLIRIKRKCKECKEDFIAKTISSVYCSRKCYLRNYKMIKKNEIKIIQKIKIVPLLKKFLLEVMLTIKEATLLYPIFETTYS
ncbi:hypothetical protein SAMN05421738_106190 [Algoriella xinjiangensis]|uniref:Uncharacterized protein n=1 Tax=Algoriella xinjiangensis TaxID=684065 RepID=A0A1I4W8K5_9FLAO|nr:hypothetical protein SAMN05421738_106190 [Algoriella xinjiangensis]